MIAIRSPLRSCFSIAATRCFGMQTIVRPIASSILRIESTKAGLALSAGYDSGCLDMNPTHFGQATPPRERVTFSTTPFATLSEIHSAV